MRPSELREIEDDAAAKYARLEKLRLEKGGARTESPAVAATITPALSADDFVAAMSEGKFIYLPTGEFWPSQSVNARVAPIVHGRSLVSASKWLAEHRPVEQFTWMPGAEQLIRGRLIAPGGWIERDGVTCLNLYRPPAPPLGDSTNAQPWIDHVAHVYRNDAAHIIQFFAHRVQHPGEKINHALVLGGAPGIGKDTILQPVRHAVGPWNCSDISPQQLIGRFNGFVRCVILVMSEARDLGDLSRYALYEHSKVYTAAPPDVLRCDEKNLREYVIPNVCGVVITTNHKTDGIYLPADDRRHYVAWSDLKQDDFPADYWRNIYAWYEAGGHGHVAAYLRQVDLSSFDPKAPPTKTRAFWEIADANRAPEDAELADALDKLAWPNAITLSRLATVTDGGFAEWLLDRRNSRQIPHRLEAVGYVPIRNDAAEDGRWKLDGRRQAVYARTELTVRDRIAAVRRLVEAQR